MRGHWCILSHNYQMSWTKLSRGAHLQPNGLATLIAAVKLQRSCLVWVLPDIRKCSKADQIMGANGYSSWRSLGAIRLPIWLKNCHNIAIFLLHSLPFLVTLLVVRTTVMLTLGSERTQTLVTHVGWWYGVIFTLPMNLSGVRGVQNQAIFWSKSGLYGGLVLGWGSNLESVSWAISHPNAWDNMNQK